jgi:hypothetical protein
MLLLCAASLLIPAAAHASCKADLQDLKPRIELLKSTNKERYALASKWWNRASESEPIDEVECHNYYLRAYKALTQPLEVINNCLGPNAYLPQCAAAPIGRAQGPAAGAFAAGPVGAGAGGGGGGAGGGAPAQPFSPPGSLSSGGTSN